MPSQVIQPQGQPVRVNAYQATLTLIQGTQADVDTIAGDVLQTHHLTQGTNPIVVRSDVDFLVEMPAQFGAPLVRVDW